MRELVLGVLYTAMYTEEVITRHSVTNAYIQSEDH